ncbi:MAG TPA: hypothetical protein VNE62_00040 [Actinomycetota bacterium]|nr:hypothetical protein [Actinomycetota bacterium]
MNRLLRTVFVVSVVAAGSWALAGSASAGHFEGAASKARTRIAERRAVQGVSHSVGSRARTPLSAGSLSEGRLSTQSHLDLRGRRAITADIVHDGDNRIDIDQDADARSGDCVAGAQVFGAVGGNVRARLTNVSDGSDCESGNARATNFIGRAHAGPVLSRRAPATSGADLAVTKEPSGFSAGGARFTVTVTNQGTAPAINATLVDQATGAAIAPAQVTLTSGEGWTCAGNQCSAPAVAPGATATFAVVVPVNIVAGGTVFNTATVSSASDSNASNNSDDAVQAVPGI